MSNKLIITESLLYKLIEEESLSVLRERKGYLSEGVGARIADAVRRLVRGRPADEVFNELITILKKSEVAEHRHLAKTIKNLKNASVKALPEVSIKKATVKEWMKELEWVTFKDSRKVKIPKETIIGTDKTQEFGGKDFSNLYRALNAYFIKGQAVNYVFDGSQLAKLAQMGPTFKKLLLYFDIGTIVPGGTYVMFEIYDRIGEGITVKGNPNIPSMNQEEEPAEEPAAEPAAEPEVPLRVDTGGTTPPSTPPPTQTGVGGSVRRK